MNHFGIVGGGWRAEFYLRIAKQLPEKFQVSGVVVRDEGKGKQLEEQWGIRTLRTVEELLAADRPAFVVVSVPRAVCPAIIQQLAESGVPVLTETPPASDLEGLIRLHSLVKAGALIQVAEQYPFQPYYQAIQQVIASGRLGTISQAQVSQAHGYHGIALLRKCLGISYENAAITGKRFVSSIVQGSNRQGKPKEHKIVESNQDFAYFDFDGKLGLYDFTGDQYFSWIRSPRLLVRGDQGEISNQDIRYLLDYETPMQTRFERVQAGENGNLEGYYLKGIVAAGEWVYQNPFAPARLTDDEIAVATSLLKMGEYVNGGPSFYSLEEASQDHYLSLLMESAIQSGKQLRSETQIWT